MTVALSAPAPAPQAARDQSEEHERGRGTVMARRSEGRDEGESRSEEA